MTVHLFLIQKFTIIPAFVKNTTCGGASRAILRANLRTHPRSSTVVHSLGFALIYPQPCTTIHPPIANKPFYSLTNQHTLAVYFCTVIFSAASPVIRVSQNLGYYQKFTIIKNNLCFIKSQAVEKLCLWYYIKKTFISM